MCDWIRECAELVSPLYERMKERVLDSKAVQTDETPVPVLAPGNGKTKTGRLWAYVRDDRPAGDTTPPAVWFAYSPDRKGEHLEGHLREFGGTLQADAYAGFDQLYQHGRVQEADCWAHIRRKLYDLQVAHKSPVAQEALERIAALYAIESEIRSRPPSGRREVRQARARPLPESLHAWLEGCLPKLSRKSDTTAAVKYALGLWEALVRYVDDGRLEIDNNGAERSLRGLAVGRKIWMFLGSDHGGRTAAVLSSLIATCKKLHIDPFAYLRDVFARISTHRQSQLDELLPDRWMTGATRSL
jgi:hypothetical protein